MTMRCIVLLIFIIFQIAWCENAFPSEVEMSALEDLYYATDGYYWSYSAQSGIPWTFNESSPYANPCGNISWYGIICVSYANTSYIQQIDLGYSDLYGTLPDSIGNFTQLTKLRLLCNVLYGYLPESLGNLMNLEVIDVDTNYFWGYLPESLSNWENLIYFYVFTNLLSGTVPEYVGKWKNLNSIDTSINIFTGSIPESLGNTSLVFLNMGANPMNGSIPASLGVLTGITDFILYETDVSGSIPESFSNLTAMEYFYVYSNAITGSLPASLSSWSNIAFFLMEDNYIAGSMPESYSQWPYITDFYAGYNLITGTLPSSYCEWAYMSDFQIESNLIQGSLPDCLSNWGASITHFDVYNNLMNGTLPSSLSSWVNILYFFLEINQFSGSIPSSYDSWRYLQYFDVNTNQITGSLSPSFGNWTELLELFVAENLMTGSLPASYANMKQIQVMFLQTNYFDSSIPSEWCVLQDFINVDLYLNMITGSIPECIGNSTSMETFWVLNNYMSGSIPESIGSLAYLDVLVLDINGFTGTLPTTMCQCSQLNSLFLNINYFTGSIPSCINQLSLLSELYLDYNLLSSSIPENVAQMSLLIDLVLNDNFLSGPIDSIFNSTAQLSLSSVNLNQNSLTGSIPDEVFLLPQLLTLGLTSNCLSASLSSIICQSRHLAGLVMDGIGTASDCRHSILSGIPGSTSYSENAHLKVDGTIPACLFGMPSIQTLHLSGNSIGDGLTDLTVSHNSLTGTIPSIMQNHVWTSFDVSFNKLSGILNTHFNSSTTNNANSSVSLQVNRLSGAIPNALTNAKDIHLVDGNMFSCGIVDRGALPASDPSANNYQCGSNILDLAMYLFGGLLVAIGVGMILAVQCNKEFLSDIRTVYNSCVHNEVPVFRIFNSDLKGIVMFGAVVVIFTVIILMPVYAGLSTNFGTYTAKYAWVISAAFLSGITPGAVLLCLFLALITVVVVWTNQWPVKEFQQRKSLVSGSAKMSKVIMIFLVNLMIVLGMNILYVYVLQQSQSQFVTFIVAIAIALFKLLWTEQCLPVMFKSVEATIVHRTSAQLFNFIVVPLGVLAVISPNCFYYAFANSEPVSAVVDFYVCEIFAPNGTCLGFEYEPIESSYTPPFVYNYQCTSTFISDYSSVYVYMFIISSLLTPLMFSLIQYVSTHRHPDCAKFLPNILKPPAHCVIDRPNIVIVNREVMLIRFITALSLLLTFGVVVPLVSIVVLVYLVTSTFFIQLSLGRLLEQSDKDLQNKYQNVLMKECVDVLTSVHSIMGLIVVFACIFYALILWDIVGDQVGLVAALWAPLLMVLPPLCYYTALAVIRRRRKLQSSEGKETMGAEVEMRESSIHIVISVDSPMVK